MIISFSVENWMSFKDKVSLSMIASRERQHAERIAKLDKYKTRILPVAAIYGGNASGKTNLFKALRFAQEFIEKGTQPDSLILVDPFRLDPQRLDKPVNFAFELLIDEDIYEYSFSVTRKEVLKEKLVKINSTSERTLYLRENSIKFDSTLDNDQFLHFAFRGTRGNQLFLTNTISQNIDTFRPIYNWFRDTLELIAPDTRFAPFIPLMDKNNPLYSTINMLLPQLDTGISRLGGEEIPFESIIIPPGLKKRIQDEVKDGETIGIQNLPTNENFSITRKAGEFYAEKLCTYHSRTDGSEEKFEINQESDGSQRIIDLLPAFIELSSQISKKVFVIDEMDRSLHTLLTQWLLEKYLASNSSKSRSQLLFTTHNILLMDQDLFRRDEMWITERQSDGASDLISLGEYKDVRSDKDIRKSYLQGRMGGIPRILLTESSIIPNDTVKHGEKVNVAS